MVEKKEKKEAPPLPYVDKKLEKKIRDYRKKHPAISYEKAYYNIVHGEE